MAKPTYQGREVKVLIINESHNLALISEQPDGSKAYKVDLSELTGVESILETLRRRRLQDKPEGT